MDGLIEKLISEDYELTEDEMIHVPEIITFLLKRRNIEFLNFFLYEYAPKLNSEQLQELLDIFISDRTRALYENDIKERISIDDLTFYFVLHGEKPTHFFVKKLIPLRLSYDEMQNVVSGMTLYPDIIEEMIKYRIFDYINIPEFRSALTDTLWLKLTERFEDTVSHIYEFINPYTGKPDYVNFVFDSEGDFSKDDYKLLRNIPEQDCNLTKRDAYHKIVDEYILSSDFINFSLRIKRISALAGYKIANLIKLIKTRGKVYQKCTLFRGIKPQSKLSIGDIIEDPGFSSKTTNVVSSLFFAEYSCCVLLIHYPNQSTQLDACFKDTDDNLQYEKLTFPGEKFKILDKGEMIWKTRIITTYYAEYVGNLYTRPIQIDRSIDSRYYNRVKPILQRGGAIIFLLDEKAPRTFFGRDRTMIPQYQDLYYTIDNIFILAIKSSKDRTVNVIPYRNDKEVFQTYAVHTEKAYHLPLLSMQVAMGDVIRYGDERIGINDLKGVRKFIYNYINSLVKDAFLNDRPIKPPVEL